LVVSTIATVEIALARWRIGLHRTSVEADTGIG
jgi:hypothetical protein